MTELLTPTCTTRGTVADDDLSLRELALEQLKKKRGFHTHLLAYVLVNSSLWLVWAVILAAVDGPWFPWPLFPLVGWGIGLVFHAWDTYGRRPFGDADIDREVERLRARRLA